MAVKQKKRLHSRPMVGHKIKTMKLLITISLILLASCAWSQTGKGVRIDTGTGKFFTVAKPEKGFDPSEYENKKKEKKPKAKLAAARISTPPDTARINFMKRLTSRQ